jgi:hypothetical protein
MHLTKTGIALAAFLAGCGASAAASQLVIPSARAGATPARWEYFCINGNDVKGEWNRAGAEGWELVGEFKGFSSFTR